MSKVNNNKLKKMLQNGFLRNVLLIVTGTAGAQVINISIMPILTRLYEPSMFGILGTFTAICTFIMPIVSLTYPTAIVIVKTELEAKKIGLLSFVVSVIFSILALTFLIFFYKDLILYFNIEEVGLFVFFIPCIIFITALNQVGRQWAIRNGFYKNIVRSVISQSVFISGSRLFIGWFFPFSSILIITYILGNLISSLILCLNFLKSLNIIKLDVNFNELRSIAIKYKDFPIYRAPQVALHAFSESMPVLLLGSLFGTVIVGYYMLARLTLGAPVGLIGQSVSDVFFPKFVKQGKAYQDKRKLLIKVTSGITIISIIPFFILSISGSVLFGIIFGDEWSTSGVFASYMSIWLLCILITRPVVSIIPALKLQKFFLFFEFFTLILKFISIYFSYLLYSEPTISIACFSIVNAICYIYLLIYVCKKVNYENCVHINSV